MGHSSHRAIAYYASVVDVNAPARLGRIRAKLPSGASRWAGGIPRSSGESLKNLAHKVPDLIGSHRADVDALDHPLPVHENAHGQADQAVLDFGDFASAVEEHRKGHMELLAERPNVGQGVQKCQVHPEQNESLPLLFSYAATRSGISRRHGGHQLAQKLINTGRPCRSDGRRIR